MLHIYTFIPCSMLWTSFSNPALLKVNLLGSGEWRFLFGVMPLSAQFDCFSLSGVIGEPGTRNLIN